MQLYVIKFVDDLRQVCDFLTVFMLPPPIKLCYDTMFVESGIYTPITQLISGAES